ncbi:hypothetical protein [Fusobacterium gastrosuis]|uniref:hypothetical protein n=1 Tax=Fusobacterium gastrosuis TaxID=1755100 RepID=UPI0029738172|nr:hypothetical protein [Fusobacteriaceae bacterium]MDY5714272.1 hypothetical protein [Fusobacterium gastrosuis]
MNFEEQLKKKMEEMQKTRNVALVKEDDFKIKQLPEEIKKKFLIFEEETEEEIAFLEKETLSLLNLQQTNILELGKIINSVFEKFASQGSKNGTYTKWLKLANINNKTAIRYRKKFLIFQKLEVKEQILLINNKILDLFDVEVISKKLNAGESINLITYSEETIKENTFSISEKYLNLFSSLEKRMNSSKIPEEIKSKVVEKMEEILDILKNFE